MQLSQIQVGKTYKGERDYKRGLGPFRTVIEHDQVGGLVTLRMEAGANPPECYVMLATMSSQAFAEWAEGEARELLPTPAQKRYLASLLPDILVDEPDLADVPLEAFVARVAHMGFDGAAKPGELRVARGLLEKGALSEVHPHDGPMLAGPYVEVKLSVKGAALIFDLMMKGYAK